MEKIQEPILVTRSSMPTIEEYMKEIQPIFESHWMTNMGHKHQELKQKVKEYLDAKELSLMCNGHMALELTLQALDLSGEVITTPFTFASTTHAIVRNGLKPVFCDINSEDFTIDVNQIEKLITEKTTAIVPVHVYGNICDVEALERIAKKHDLKIIYDAAHAFGVKYNGRGICQYGDASIFSFHATKVFNTIEGGAVAYNTPELKSLLYQLKNFGICDEVTVKNVGSNAKMNEFQAAMGLCNLRHFETSVGKRKEVCEIYRQYLSDIKGLRLMKVQENVETNYAYFPVIIEDDFGYSRDSVYMWLKEHNIYARKYFYPLTSAFECYKGKYDESTTPNAENISERVLTLPLYEDLDLDIVENICKILLAIRV